MIPPYLKELVWRSWTDARCHSELPLQSTKHTHQRQQSLHRLRGQGTHPEPVSYPVDAPFDRLRRLPGCDARVEFAQGFYRLCVAPTGAVYGDYVENTIVTRAVHGQANTDRHGEVDECSAHEREYARNSILQAVTLVTEIVTNADLYWEVATQSHSDWAVWTSFTQHKKQGGIGHDESGLVIHRSTMRIVYAYRN